MVVSSFSASAGGSEEDYSPEGPSTQYLRTLVPQTIFQMVFGTRVLKYAILGPSG